MAAPTLDVVSPSMGSIALASPIIVVAVSIMVAVVSLVAAGATVVSVMAVSIGQNLGGERQHQCQNKYQSVQHGQSPCKETDAATAQLHQFL